MSSAMQSFDTFLRDVEAKVETFGKTNKQEIKEWLFDWSTALKAAEFKAEEMAGEARVKAHLARMDAKDELAGLGTRLDRVTHKLNHEMSRAGDEARHQLKGLVDRFEALKSRLEASRERDTP